MQRSGFWDQQRYFNTQKKGWKLIWILEDYKKYTTIL